MQLFLHWAILGILGATIILLLRTLRRRLRDAKAYRAELEAKAEANSRATSVATATGGAVVINYGSGNHYNSDHNHDDDSLSWECVACIDYQRSIINRRSSDNGPLSIPIVRDTSGKEITSGPIDVPRMVPGGDTTGLGATIDARRGNGGN